MDLVYLEIVSLPIRTVWFLICAANSLNSRSWNECSGISGKVSLTDINFVF